MGWEDILQHLLLDQEEETHSDPNPEPECRLTSIGWRPAINVQTPDGQGRGVHVGKPTPPARVTRPSHVNK